jgi:hypothetical protein
MLRLDELFTGHYGAGRAMRWCWIALVRGFTRDGRLVAVMKQKSLDWDDGGRWGHVELGGEG